MTDRRNDAGLAGPMVDDIARRYGKAPDRLLIDTSYATSEDIIALAAHAAGAVSVYTPPPVERDDVKPATLARRIRKREKEPVCLKEWRERMASEAGQAVYALRKRIERINADRKNHGFGFLPVRGLIKAKAHALWHAIANNLMAARRLRANASARSLRGRAAPKERSTRTEFIHDAGHSSMTAPDDRSPTKKSIPSHALERE